MHARLDTRGVRPHACTVDAYPATHAATTAAEGSDPAAACETFLSDAACPLVLMLKPPHELTGVSAASLGRAACASYGSFNLEQYRKHVADSEEEAWMAQERLLSSFKSCAPRDGRSQHKRMHACARTRMHAHTRTRMHCTL